MLTVIGALVLAGAAWPGPAQAATVLAQDSFDRTASTSWGSATAGGAWSSSGSANSVAVGSGVGSMRFDAVGRGHQLWLGSVSSASAATSAEFTFDKPAVGGNQYASLLLRRSQSNNYSAVAKVNSDGTVDLSLRSSVAGKETILTTTRVAGVSVAAGTKLFLRGQAVGTNPTTLDAGLSVGSPGTGWQVSTTAADSGLQAAGNVGVSTYLSGSLGNAPVTLRVDNFNTTTVASTNSPPSASFTAVAQGMSVTVDGSAAADSDGSIASWAWDYGDGTTATGVKPAAKTYASTGTKTIRLTVTDDRGATATTTRNVTASAPSTKPDASNTGTLNTNQTVLTSTNKPYASDRVYGDVYQINTANAVYNGWTFNYPVVVQAPGVKFTNCNFRGKNGNPDGSGLLYIMPNSFPAGQPSAVVEDSTLIPAYPNNTIDGVRGSNFTLRRVEIANTVDGVNVGGTATYGDPTTGNVLIENSWIHDLIHYNDNSHADGSHNDGVQIGAGRNIRVTGTRIDGTIYNAGFMVTQGRGPVSNLTITNNWLAGGACTINVYDKEGSAITGLNMSNNVFTRRTTRNTDCAIIVSAATRAVATAAGNTWHDGSTPAPNMKNGG